jgi:hypothetical protein
MLPRFYLPITPIQWIPLKRCLTVKPFLNLLVVYRVESGVIDVAGTKIRRADGLQDDSFVPLFMITSPIIRRSLTFDAKADKGGKGRRTTDNDS